ncbi:zinc-binding alcohol dehydrogenase family protein [Lysinibacter sp. HNR]|uniref:zinc-binding alcohol dehydrogenase family protein n=1 Tax=Lysinibacter sp. HNR TaxID=3031408 RepID=UPI002435EC2A|nr:zinc-binding alcohol dehydrogenase family protein [Lysinibacter sp. HNR]WGD36247.1 zinc-binding alcohol dehydrogenase family protein [Lysinibacter sp. HNR]
MTITEAIGYNTNLPVTDPRSLLSAHTTVPELGRHDLLVETQAVSVNPVDVKLRAGTPTKNLRVLGFDAAGTVIQTGKSVTLFAPGDEIFYAGSINRPGTNQRLHVVDERIAGRKPRRLSFADAASLPLTAITAWESLFNRLSLNEKSSGTLLVVGASGGVGSILLQLVETLLPEVKVIATASNQEKETWAHKHGAEYAVNHRANFVEQVLTISPDGVDWIFTAHSEGEIEKYAEIIKPFGQIVAIDDGPRDVSPLKAKSISWHWELMFTRSLYQTPDMIEQHHLLNTVADLVDSNKLHPTTSRTLTPINLANLREAHRLVETGRTVGKVVLHTWE